MRGNRESGGNQEAPKIERIARMRIRAGRRQAIVLHDVTCGPGTNRETDERQATTHGQRERRGSWTEREVQHREYEAKGQAQSSRGLLEAQSAISRRMLRAM